MKAKTIRIEANGRRYYATLLDGAWTCEGVGWCQDFVWGRLADVERAGIAQINVDGYHYTHGSAAYRALVDRLVADANL